MKIIKVLSAFGVLLLAGCEQYVANPKELSDKMAKCDQVDMRTAIINLDKGNWRVVCKEKTK